MNNKITNGTSSTTFSPYKTCNRAEIVTFLWRAAGSPEPTSTRNPFTRCERRHATPATTRPSCGPARRASPPAAARDDLLPRIRCARAAQIVTFLYRYAGKPSGYYSNPFKDVSATNEASYYNAILWAVGKGITTGHQHHDVLPLRLLQRAPRP